MTILFRLSRALSALVLVCTLAPTAAMAREKGDAKDGGKPRKRSEGMAFVISAPSGATDEARTALRLLTANLEANRVEVIPPEDDAKAVVPERRALTAAQKEHVNRVFLLALDPLGSKVLVTLKETAADGTTVYQLEPITIFFEELPKLMPRMVKTLLRRKPLKGSEQIYTVSSDESEPYKKKPGEWFWGFGVRAGTFLASNPTSMFGAWLKFAFETKAFRIDLDLGGMSEFKEIQGVSDFAIRGYWVPMAGDWSPYVGGGLGYMRQDMSLYEAGGGLDISFGGGAEFFRLYDTRLAVHLLCHIPAFTVETLGPMPGQDSSKWAPLLDGGLTVLF